MARTYFLSNSLNDVLDPLHLTYTPLSLGTANRYDSTGNSIQSGYSTGLLNYNVSLTRVGNGDSTNDSLRGTGGSDLFIWDFAVLSLGVSLPGLLTRFGLPSGSQTAAIEVFDLAGGDDMLNLTHYDQPVVIPLLGLLGQDPQSYDFAATAFGGDGNDILWSSTGNDVLHGDANNDSLNGGGGNDTLYGGTGLDRLEGGEGSDLLIDTANGAAFHGGGGDDVIVMSVNDASLTLGPSTGDDGTATDGDDRFYFSGAYASASVSLGGGNDLFISSATNSAAADSVSGGTGLDLISTWDGNDRIAGDEGEDALWGGAGNDTIFGGAGGDYLYVGSGTDTVFGGGGHDYVYFGRQDGDANQYYDLARAGETADGTSNTLVVMGVFDPSETGGDGFDDAQGIYELDGDIMDNSGDDRVYVSQVSGNIYRLEIVGGGMTGADIEFDVRDVDQIILWDNAAVSGQNQQYFHWDADAGAYVPGL